MNNSELKGLLRGVNFAVNRETHYKVDYDLYGVEDFWTIMSGRKTAGDCEDYAITKRQRLIDLGVPANDLRLCVCYAPNGEGHAVLTIDIGVVTYVLDNNYDDLKTYTYLKDAGYQFIARQAATGYNWVRIAN